MPNGMAIKLSLARQVLLALNFLHHEVRLVHGDLKPDNILLKRNDENQLVAKVPGNSLPPTPTKALACASLAPFTRTSIHHMNEKGAGGFLF